MATPQRLTAEEGAPGGRLPATLRAAVWLLGAQAVGLGVVTGYLVYEDLTAPARSRGTAVAITAVAALTAVALAALARWLARRRGLARGPAIVLQLLMVLVGYTTATTGMPGLGVVLMGLGLCGTAALLAASTRESLGVR